jgi:hypothetical protein
MTSLVLFFVKPGVTILLKGALEPLLDMILEAKEEGTLPVLERIKSAPSHLGKYINDMA